MFFLGDAVLKPWMVFSRVRSALDSYERNNWKSMDLESVKYTPSGSLYIIISHCMHDPECQKKLGKKMP